MKTNRVCVWVVVVSCLCTGGLLAQQTDSNSATSTPNLPAASQSVPRMIMFNGTVKDLTGKPLTGPVDLSFAIYKEQTAAEPLWQESQTLNVDEQGHYTVLLGAMQQEGLPVELFTTGEARWLGVSAGKLAEQPRTLLVSVPYALKAGDAETLGGKPASAYALAQPGGGLTTAGTATALSGVPTADLALPAQPKSGLNPNVAGTGVQNYIPLWTDSAGTLGNSVIYQSSGLVGIGTTTPGVALDVSGASAGLRLRGTGTHQLTVTGATSGRLGQDAAGFFFSSDTNGASIRFGTNNGSGHEWMRITSAGNVGIGTTTPAQKLDVAGNVNSSGNVTAAGSVTAASFAGGGAGLTGLNASNLASGTVPGTALTGTYNINISGNAATATNALALGGLASSAFEQVANKNAASGYAGLDSSSRLAKAQAPSATAYKDASNAFTTGTQDLSAATATLPVKSVLSASAPSSCTASKELLIKTDATAGQQLFICNGSGNGWTLVGDGSGGAGVTSFNSRTGAVSPATNDYAFSQISGTVGSTQLSGTYSNALTLSSSSNSFTGSGAGLTGLSASNLGSGTLPDGRLSGTYTGALTLSNASNSFTGSGAGLTALNASNLSSGTVPSARISGTYSNALTFSSASNSFTGNGAGLTNVNADTLNGLSATSYATLGANTFVGSQIITGDLALTGSINSGLRVESTSGVPNVVGGFSGNSTTSGVEGAAIGGGGGGGIPNRVTDSFSTVAGGQGNVAGNDSGSTGDAGVATVGGGWDNTASAAYSTVAGGDHNIASGYWATVGGGRANTPSGNGATVSGGRVNNASGDDSMIAGGYNNTSQGIRSFAAGTQAKALHNGSFVWGDSTVADVSSTDINQFVVRATGGAFFSNNLTAGHFFGDGSGLTNVTASTATDLTCTGCVSPPEVSFSYAGSSSQGGAATSALTADTATTATSATTAATATNALALGGLASSAFEQVANKNAVSGYAGLDSSSRIAKAQAPSATAYKDASNAFTTGTQDLSAATATLPVKSVLSASAPSSCTASKELLIKTDATAGQQLFICNGSGNGWTLVGDGSGGAGVTSFNSRTGAVLPATNDYAFSQISGTVGSTQLSGSYSNALTLSSSSNSFTGSGAGLTGLSASSLSSGTLPDARLGGTYTSALTLNNASNSFTGSGAGLTGLSASSLSSGTLGDARLSGTYTSALTLNNASNSFTGSGAGLTGLSATSLSSGTLPDARLSGTYTSALTLNNASNSFTGNGAGLTTLTAANISSGTAGISISGNAATATNATSATTATTATNATQLGGVAASGYPQLATANTYTSGKQTFVASTTSAATLNLPSGVAPTTPATGDFWNLSGILKFYDGSHTNSLTTIQAAPTSGHLAVWSGTAGLLADGGAAATGTVSSVGLVGTANQITVTGASPITTSGSWTLSFPSGGVTLPGTTTGTFSGSLTGNVTGNVSGSSGSTSGNAATATGLAATPTQCGSNNWATGIAASGAANCSQPGYSNLSGTLPNAALSGTYSTNAVTLSNASNSFTGSGAGLTGLSASSLSSGTLGDARLGGTYTSALTLSNASNSFTGSGAGLTALNASNLGSGTVPSARISGTYSNALTLSSASNSFTGDGTGLANVSATTAATATNALALGGVAPSGYATVGANSFAGTQTISSGDLSVGSGDISLPPTTGASAGVIYLGGRTFIHSYGSSNTFVGPDSGNFTSTGVGNTAIGNGTLQYDTEGRFNVAVGHVALQANSTGSGNTALGHVALEHNTTGGANTATGEYALWKNTSGYDDTASGVNALASNDGGIGNTADGFSALGSNTGGNYNTALGHNSGIYNTTGSYNTFIGMSAGVDSSHVDLTNATAIGAYATVSQSNSLILGGTGSYAVNVGIGTNAPGQRLTVAGTVESTSGGFKFPDGTTQATASTGGGTATDLTCTTCVSSSEVDFNYAGSSSKGGAAANALLLNGLASSAFQAAGSYAILGANAFTANQTVSGTVSATSSASGATAIYGQATNVSASNTGVHGRADGDGGVGVYGEAHNGASAAGVWGYSTSGWAGDFSGNVNISGSLSKAGGSFKIDHPLDPANKYLSHSFVESPDMKNVYDGVTTLDDMGEAVVELPEWFEALNENFRYQLTPIGGPAPNLYIARKIAQNRFKIAGGTPGLEVSWQVTGTRHDAWANAHRIPVESEKSATEKGHYLHPDLYGASEEKGMSWAHHPELMEKMGEGKAQPK